MFAELIQAILNGAKTETIKVDGTTYVTREISLPPAEATAVPLTVHTLDGFCHYIETATEFPPDAMIVVNNPTSVSLVSVLRGRERQRETYVQAQAIAGGGMGLGQFLPIEKFVIQLQQNFLGGEHRADMLKLVGNLRDEVVRTATDDGVTQQVTVRAGVAKDTAAIVRNPWVLRQYRTFAEVEQPESAYILRLQREGDGLPLVGLFEVVDNRWQLAAIESITNFIRAKTQKIPVFA